MDLLPVVGWLPLGEVGKENKAVIILCVSSRPRVELVEWDAMEPKPVSLKGESLARCP